MTNRILTIAACLLVALAIVFGLPYLRGDDFKIESEHVLENSYLNQDIISYNQEARDIYKVYVDSKLIGVLSDRAYLDAAIADYYEKNYRESYPDTALGLVNGVNIIAEKSFVQFANIDAEIFNYLKDNRLLGIRTNGIELATSEGVYDVIYVQDIDTFYKARDTFLTNFIDQEALDTMRKGQSIPSPSNFGAVDTGVRIQETMTIIEAIAAPESIMRSFEEVYNYFCYGRNQERQYYQVKEGDTLQGVGFYFKDMSAHQIMMINPDVIVSEDQILTVGMMLNVTYFTSPITVTVTRQRLSQEDIVAPTPEYREDNSLVAGATRIDVNEVNGLKNVLYEETWVNGVLQSGRELSSVTVREPIRAVISLGTMRVPDVGTGNFIWPVENPKITCMWGCYFGHMGTDIVNQYDRYGDVFAADTGVVNRVSYDSISGNYVIIDHQNGFKTWYGHCSEIYVNEGQIVQRGEVIARIGSTGYATGPHVHFHMYVDGVQTNACQYMNCASIPGGS